VVLLPTFPACRFVPIFEARIRELLDDGDLTVTVEIESPDVVWDRSRMAPEARQRLDRTWQTTRRV
jgi:metal-sulfur cluster biosynthetic enzyme